MAFACCVAQLAHVPGTTFGLSLFVPHFERDLGVTASRFSLLWALALVACAVTLPRIGALIDERGSLRALATSAVVFSGCVFSLGFVESQAALCALLYLLRLSGPGLIELVGVATINRWFVETRGIAMSAFTSASMLTVAMPALVVRVVEADGWRSAYGKWSGAIFGVLCLCCLFLRNDPETQGMRPDGGRGRRLVGDVLHAPSNEPTIEREREVPARPSWTRAQAIRTRAFWAILLGIASFEFVWTGINMHIVAVFRASDPSWTFEEISRVDVIVSITSVVASLATGAAIDRNCSTLRLYAAALMLSSVAAALATRLSSGAAAMALGLVMGTMLGILVVAFNVVFAACFGTKHVGAIQSLGFSAMFVATGGGPLIFGGVHDRTGGFASVLWPAAGFNLAAAAAVFTTPLPPRDPPKPRLPAVELSQR